jgi:hypothetical protein
MLSVLITKAHLAQNASSLAASQDGVFSSEAQKFGGASVEMTLAIAPVSSA